MRDLECYFQFQHGGSEVKSRGFYLSVHWETQDDLLSFGDRNSGGNLETTRAVVAYGVPVFQVRLPDHLVNFIVYINGGTKTVRWK